MIKNIFLALFAFSLVLAGPSFSLIKKGEENKEAVLVIGGTQGDEPGGFFSANLLATEYNITKGALWVVPNLNFPSIVKNSRGAAGDMNRKFAKINPKDPDYKAVNFIKDTITHKDVAFVVHLHDGSGFYRPKFIDAKHSPARWGNCAIIDQSELKGVKYGELEINANRIIKTINEKIKDKEHIYHLKNTRTAEKDSKNAEQLNSLTYFAISKGKPAYANEASKELDVYTRIYYHLIALEEYMRIAGVEFERSFRLTPKGIEEVMKKEIRLSLFDDRFLLALKDPRASINYIPTPKYQQFSSNYQSQNPLIAIVDETRKNKNGKESKETNIYYGNKLLTSIRPQYFEFAHSLPTASVKIDGRDEIVTFGSKIHVDDNIIINSQNNVRVNVIGYENPSKKETDVKITKKDIQKNFSIDKAGKIFRVEFYEQERGKKDKFLGMFLVEFASLKH
ncbi:MAG: M99 family carboxypeptidase catalytic domain-containing protein [Campylobacter sp.]|uniref:M99 family carboxypeptidase catalytic domain-containing protein n=1 Tax=Campylobacter sp. TaxID=205 RepID=UPI002A9154B4|nr:M99 family carboxypeptidase catalytic domain-containing protein [Campylobacter sp.]MDY6188718.1 M99 family carboxypeptidase catalytic domain-containing protein [Campylobacter sp.]